MNACADAFSACHPLTGLTFFLGALVCGMCLTDPGFLALSVLFSFAYYFVLKRSRAFRMLLSMLAVFALVSLLNPLFNTHGATVLFTWLGGRPYTLEALRFGMGTGAMCVTIFVWFACYNVVMTSDKFLTLFAPLLPAISLVLTMILRLVPSFARKARQISGARCCLGKAGQNRQEKLRGSMAVLSALTSWALEGSLITADSMRARGFGTGQKRTSFSVYHFTLQDFILLALMVLTLAVVLFCRTHTVFALCAYGFFLALPTLIDLKENLTWHILRSRI
jgi:energy-coupling factor transport system permease protein